MPLRVNNNITAITARRALGVNSRTLATRIERLSTGLRINRGADDAAGLAISEGMRAEIGGLTQGVRNAEQATNLSQVAEGALNQVSAMLVRMRELAVQAASSTVNNTNRENLQAEFAQLVAEIDRVALATSYNNTVLLTGFGNTISESQSTALTASATTGVAGVTLSGATASTYVFIDNNANDNQITVGNGVATQTIDIGSILDNDAVGGVVATGTTAVANFDRVGVILNLDSRYRDGDLDGQTIVVENGTGGSFQVGPDDKVVDRIEFGLDDMRASGPELNLNVTSIATLESARSSMSQLDLAIERVASKRANIGAIQNRLAFTVASANNAIENIQASESSIRDADVASEVSEFTRAQILTQAATAVLAQANALPQTALSLLQ
ncbi:MAG: flagellin [Gemmatimonadetes bacterium]|nr:flagellin [Gemmatimonadota bacterium]|tara:strand:+ start:3791 stop:4945 length:1155 start_codon:yes stop_codon:yes gene_type:complete